MPKEKNEEEIIAVIFHHSRNENVNLNSFLKILVYQRGLAGLTWAYNIFK